MKHTHFKQYSSKQTLGFTVVEMMVVVSIIAILALIVVPSSLNRIIKEQVQAALPLADTAKEPIAEAWKAGKTLPVDNAAIGLPVPQKVVSNFITSLAVHDGVIELTFGNKANGQLKGKVLTIRPAVIEESHVVPITWVCGNANPPSPMVVKGANNTDIKDDFLPQICRK